MSSEAIEELITQRVADALATYETKQKTKNGNRNGDENGVEANLMPEVESHCYSSSKSSGGKSKTLTCFECRKQGQYHNECPELKNLNRGNQAGNSEARERVYALGGGKADQDPMNIADNVDA
nr:hypothetical protein [Tanacetum cinerariifolium]GEW78368.1 hypothetical protein [Tanacetum cinerariifolium]